MEQDIKIWDKFYYLLTYWTGHNFNEAEVIAMYDWEEYGNRHTFIVLQKNGSTITYREDQFYKDYWAWYSKTKEDALEKAKDRTNSEIRWLKHKMKEQEDILSVLYNIDLWLS